MLFRKSIKPLLAMLAVLVAVALSTVAAYAQGGSFPLNFPRYMYYGKELPPAEILRRYNAGEALHCVQQITEQTLQNDAADLFMCFNTYEEAMRNSAENKPMVRYYDQVRQQRTQDQPQPQRGRVPETNHWALYANSFYNNWMFDLHNDQSNSNHTGVWSIWRDGSPNDITIWDQPNFGGFSYTYSSAQCCLLQVPFGGGGGRSSAVP